MNRIHGKNILGLCAACAADNNPPACWIQTASGRAFEPLNPKPEQIHLGDIAHALANVCRFTGHVARFYSVAEHSVRVARLLRADMGERAAQYGLLHDGSEAYLADVASPLKRLPEFDGYRRIEAFVQAAIYRRVGLDPDAVPLAVRTADLILLATEKEQLLGDEPRPWGDLPVPLPAQAGDRFGWSPAKARREFVAAIGEHFGRMP